MEYARPVVLGLFHKAPNEFGTIQAASRFCRAQKYAREESVMRSVLLWLVGVPIPVILLLALCTHHF